MGLKSVRKNKKSLPIVEPPPPPPPTKSSSSASASSSDDNDTAVSATSSSTSTSNATVPTTSTPPPKQPPSTTTPAIPTPTVNHPTSSSSSDDSSPPPMPTPVSSKRPAETETETETKLPEKRPKKDDSYEPTGPTVASTPQKLFQRLWSDEDEIVILKGMIDYKAKKGSDPMVNTEDFLSFVKKSLFVVDVNKRQLKDKIQRLKKRFFNAKKKKLSDPHEIKAFELSQKIWGAGVQLVDNVENRVDHDDNNKVNVVNAVKKKGNNVVEEGRREEGKEKGELRDLDLEFGFSGEDEVVLKEVMRSLGEGERREVRKMVGKANEAYLEAYLLRLKVLEVAAKKMLDGLRKD